MIQEPDKERKAAGKATRENKERQERYEADLIATHISVNPLFYNLHLADIHTDFRKSLSFEVTVRTGRAAHSLGWE